MATIQCRAIEKPENEFLCEVERPASSMMYQDATDFKWKPVQQGRVEFWKVLAETMEGAMRIAQYHFYNSKILNITDNTQSK